ncbi:MAG: hypothetical protein U5K43_03750 [Halofilum sp. (in: g-proteobacteria)]|nr:hypothetical protein [Halofilum sp. (in: g-proteobacteria)]
MFRPQLEPAAPARAGAAAADDDDLRQLARRLRPRFQKALLGWYRGDDIAARLGELGVLGELSEATGNPRASACGASAGP